MSIEPKHFFSFGKNNKKKKVHRMISDIPYQPSFPCKIKFEKTPSLFLISQLISFAISFSLLGIAPI